MIALLGIDVPLSKRILLTTKYYPLLTTKNICMEFEMSIRRNLGLVACVVVLTAGCASIMHGTTQKVGISSQPTGANVMIDNMPLGITPVFADLKRSSEHVVTIEMAGYQKTQLTITKKVSGWVWGNIVFGGLVGLAVDAISGGLYNLSPEQLNAQLLKVQANNVKSKDGIYIVSVLQPEIGWKKVGALQPE